MKKRLYSLLTFGVSLALLAALYRRIEPASCRMLLERISPRHVFPIAVSLVAIDLLMALRWLIMAGVWCGISYLESLRLVLASAALNVVVPSKLGGMAKAYFLNRRVAVPGKEALSLVIYERLLDLVMLSIVFLGVAALWAADSAVLGATVVAATGIVFFFAALHVVDVTRIPFMCRVRKWPRVGRVVSWLDVFYRFHTSPVVSRMRLGTIYLLTFAIWVGHAVQVVSIFHLIVPGVPSLTVLRNMFGAIFVGFLPVSAAGIGTRDMAIVHLFRGLVGYEEALVVGAATTLVRYVVPTLVGIPFLMTLGSWRVNEPVGSR